jgi:two-component system, LytTR family, response regulator
MKSISIEPNPPVQISETDDFPFVFARDDSYFHKIALRDILYLKSDEHLVLVVTDDKKYTLTTSLKVCENQLPSTSFKRVHRSYIVNVAKIDKLNRSEIIINDQVIPLTRTFADVLFNDFVWARLLG